LEREKLSSEKSSRLRISWNCYWFSMLFSSILLPWYFFASVHSTIDSILRNAHLSSVIFLSVFFNEVFCFHLVSHTNSSNQFDYFWGMMKPNNALTIAYEPFLRALNYFVLSGCFLYGNSHKDLWFHNE
jgi:hypothetical protein